MSPADEYSDFGAHPRNIQYALKAARILNQTESGVAKVFADQSENFLERQYGTVLVALDLDFSSDEYDIGEIIATTLMTEYYSDLNRSAGQSFEHALTAVNQKLADLAAEGQNAWVGKLNALVGVIHENEVHLSLTGKAEAYLVRGPSVTHITADLHGRTNEATAKTFVSVASGDLEVGDKLLVATGEVMNHLSQHDVRRHLYLHPPNRAIRRIADQLTERGAPDRLAAIVAELTTIDLVSAETLTDEPDAIVLGAPRSHFESLGKLRPFREDTPIADYSAKARKFWERKVAPKVKRGTQTARRKSQDFVAQRRGQTPVDTSPKPAAGTPETHRSTAPRPNPAKHQAEQLLGTAHRGLATAWRKLVAVTGPYFRKAGQAIARLWRKTGIPQSAAWRKFRHLVKPLTDPLVRLWRKTGQGPRAGLYRNLLIGGLLVLGLSLFFSVNAARTAQAEERTRAQITAIQEKQAKAEASFIFKDQAGSRAQIAETKQEADALPTDVLEADVLQLQQSVDGSYERIYNIVVATGDPLTDFGPDKTFAAQSGTVFYGIGPSGELKSYNQANQEAKVANPQPAAQGQVKGLATSSSGTLLLLTDQPSVITVAADGAAQPASLAAGGTWEPGVAIDTVQQSLYVLDAEHNQIWRHTNATSGFGKGDAYLTDPVELKGARDIVTGSQVYVLKDGGIIQLTGGKPQPLAVAGLPDPDQTLAGATVLAANFTTKLIYVADPKHHRVVELNEKGEYQRQFTRDNFGGVTDLVIDDKTNTLYALVGGKLYEIKLG